MKINTSPCKGCEDRTITCHSECDKYIDFKNKNEEIKTNKRLEELRPYYRKPIGNSKYLNEWKKKIKEN